MTGNVPHIAVNSAEFLIERRTWSFYLVKQMRIKSDTLLFSPTDLTKYLQNPYVSWMDRLHAERPGEFTPDEVSANLELVFKKGLEHEAHYLESLRAAGRDICEIPESDTRFDLTLEAMKAGREIIFQAALRHESFAGYADFLVRIDRPSSLGDYSYEVWDTKLSMKAKPYFIIQLCCYAEILESIQGFRPEKISVVLGDGTNQSFRTDDFFYYYLFLKRAFLKQQATFDPDDPPEPLPEGYNERWETVAARWLVANDHLSLVAGISRVQIERLRAAGIETVAELARGHKKKIKKMRVETQEKLCEQARLQVESRGLDIPKYEVIPSDPDDPARGLALLPPSSPLDIAYDIEGYPLAEGGLEYLHGATTGEEGNLTFHDWWAHDERQEKCSFEAFIGWVFERWRRDPSMHIYHYASYEVTAAKRLMTKYAICEQEVDTLLRAGAFIDLYKVVRQGVRMGIPSYSLKKVEIFYLDGREAGVATAGDSILYYQEWLESRDGENWKTSRILNDIREYNREDCESTWKLIDWLRALQAEEKIEYIHLREETDPEAAERELTERELLGNRLLDAIPEEISGEEEKWRIHELLGWLVTFHRREQKPMWWEYFERLEMTEEELFDDIGCLAGLVRTRRAAFPIKKSTGFEYRFDPAQDSKLMPDDICIVASHPELRGTIHEIDMDEGNVVLKAGPKLMSQIAEMGGKLPRRLSLVPHAYVPTTVIEASIERVAAVYEESELLPPALSDFFHRRRPRVKGRARGPFLPSTRETLAGALDVARRMRETTLCIQGPPGSGKTHTAAHMILGLLRDGMRIGVSANSHKAICNLMDKVAKFAEEAKFPLHAVKIGGEEDDPILNWKSVDYVQSIKDGVSASHLIGGTAWTFSASDAVGMLDYLFVDEAGQVSIANLVGMTPSTKNVVLLGDQMQLGQPIRGAHPGESGQSTLRYLLQDHAIIPDDLGIFLGTTWRLHPDLCRFISGAIYEGRLQPEEGTTLRTLLTAGAPARNSTARNPVIPRDAGIYFQPVEHAGNVQGSDEEVEVVGGLVKALLKFDHTDSAGKNLGRLSLDDILIVAPYNMQIRMLKGALGKEARIGTIDKFQGQEAPVVIISMCASAGDTSPRGIEFLFNKNRLNVAISRAQSLAIIVGHPALTYTPCSSIRQMELVNLFCRVVEEGKINTCS